MSSKTVLIEMALKEFMIFGYQKTSLNNIASKLGMTKPALYYYFPSKESLFLECIRKFFDDLNKSAMGFKSYGDSSKQRIKEILINFSNPHLYTRGDTGLEDFNHLYFIFDAMKHVPEVIDLYNQSTVDVFSQIQMTIIEGVENGEIRKNIDVEAFIMEIGILIEGLSIARYMKVNVHELDLFERIFNIIWISVQENKM